MKIIMTSNPDVAFALLPWYTTEHATKEQLAEELFAELIFHPDDVFVLTVLDDDLNIHGFAIARIRDDGKVFIWQAHSEPHLESKWVDICLGMILGWAKKKGKDKVYANPNRHSKLWVRRWGFEIEDDLVTRKVAV
jgi:hypothetical protein